MFCPRICRVSCYSVLRRFSVDGHPPKRHMGGSICEGLGTLTSLCENHHSPGPGEIHVGQCEPVVVTWSVACSVFSLRLHCVGIVKCGSDTSCDWVLSPDWLLLYSSEPHHKPGSLFFSSGWWLHGYSDVRLANCKIHCDQALPEKIVSLDRH